MKLVFEFTKTGNLVFISHLDLMRLFLRVLRMSGLRPAYSHGFNPHPKMSIAMPLSLGLHSTCELLEFETDEVNSAEEAAAAVDTANMKLPEGVRVTAWCRKPDYLTKSLASFVAAATYEYMCDGVMDATEKLAGFLSRDSVIVRKPDKKSGKESDQEIRADILESRNIKDMRGCILAEATLRAAPGKTLGPLVFWNAFCGSSGLDPDELSPAITRTAILDAKGKPVKAMLPVMVKVK